MWDGRFVYDFAFNFFAHRKTASTTTQTRVFEQISVAYYIRTLQGVESNERTRSTSLKFTMNGEIHHVMLMALFLVRFERRDPASRVYVETQY